MKRWLPLLFLLWLPLAGATSHVFLVQNSGWMEPFYSDPHSRFKPLVAEVIKAAVQPKDVLVLASFNQSLPGAPSPKALLATNAAGMRDKLDAALARLAVAAKPGAATLADTDLNEALDAAINSALGGKGGLVWLFTNNRNSPNNDLSTARRNRDFYELIHQGTAIRSAYAYPMYMPVQGKQYSANGLMLYVFAVGEDGARQLDALMASTRLGHVLTEAPARLKPLDQDTVRLVPVRVEDAPGVSFTVAPNGMLQANVESKARTPQAKIIWKLENTIYPYTIAHATVAARSVLGGEDKPIMLDGSDVNGLAPGKGQPLQSRVALPVAQVPADWSLAALKAAGSAYVLPGRIEVELAEQQLELSQGFRQRMAALFPGDPLPDIFTPPARIRASHAVLPMEVRVQFGMAPLVTVLAATLAMLAAGAAATMAMTRPRKAYLIVDGEARVMQARAGSSEPIYDRAGQQVAQLKTTFFGHQLTDLRDGAQVRLGRS